MKRSIGLWQFFGFAVTSLGGTLLHFLYELTGGSPWVAPFSGVNESTFEHMKLLFWPMLLFSVIQSFSFRDRADFWCIKLHGTLVGLLLIPILFYTYNGVIGKSPDFINIAIFFVTAAIVYLYEAHLLKRPPELSCRTRVAISALAMLALLFTVFTFHAPSLGLFLDPITGTYGVP